MDGKIFSSKKKYAFARTNAYPDKSYYLERTKYEETLDEGDHFEEQNLYNVV